MTTSEQNIYISIRAEQIKYFQDTRNGHLFNKPYPLENAIESAKSQLESDLKRGNLRISLDDLLLYDNETCLYIVKNKTIELFKQSN